MNWRINLQRYKKKARNVYLCTYNYLIVRDKENQMTIMKKFFLCAVASVLCALSAFAGPETAPSVGAEGEYDVYLLIGQSNMAGRGELDESDAQPIENVYLLDGEGKVVPASNPLNIYSTIRKHTSIQKVNPGYAFSATVAKKTGRKILLVVNARGGTSINEWVKGAESTYRYQDEKTERTLSFYDEALRRTRQALQYGSLKGILWHQGCSDRGDAGYMTKLAGLVKDLRADLGADVPFVAGQLGTWNPKSGKRAAEFNENLTRISDYVPWAAWVSSEGTKPIVTKKSDGKPDLSDPHFDRESQILLGKRYAQKILKMVYGRKLSKKEMKVPSQL